MAMAMGTGKRHKQQQESRGAASSLLPDIVNKSIDASDIAVKQPINGAVASSNHSRVNKS